MNKKKALKDLLIPGVFSIVGVAENYPSTKELAEELIALLESGDEVLSDETFMEYLLDVVNYVYMASLTPTSSLKKEKLPTPSFINKLNKKLVDVFPNENKYF